MDYKKILEGVVDIINTTKKSDIGFANICAYIGENCPEIKESEDDNIRRWIINEIKIKHHNLDEDEVDFVDKAIAWLEKQGEKKQELLTKEKALKNSPFVEQNPTDKVEPKFKVGNWVIWDNKISCHVDNVYQGKNSLMYTITDTNNMTRSYSVKGFDNNAHLWTIKDAKDGDVLAGADNIIIYGGYINNYGDRIGNKAILAYCGWNGEQLVINKKKKEGFGGIGYVPATKEQRDLLFTKMKEAGYEWDAEKKELKKVEQKPTNLAKGEDYGIDGLYNAIRILEKTLGKVEGYQTDDGILEHECAISAVKKLYEQNPAWGEEEKKKLDRIYYILGIAADEHAYSNTCRLIGDKEAVELQDFLRSIAKPEQKSDWSEEDEKEYRRVEYAIMKVFGGDAYLIGWIRKFKNKLLHQTTWKPSEEQMKVLDVAIMNSHLTTAEYDGLVKLREQLKKL
jgi:hypothetical protein